MLPAARAAAAISAALPASSIATRTSWSRASVASASSFSAPTTVFITEIELTPALAITIASQTVAVATPTAPARTWRRLSCGLLWVLTCGRTATPRPRAWSAILSMLRSTAARSSSSAGVTDVLAVAPDHRPVRVASLRGGRLDQVGAAEDIKHRSLPPRRPARRVQRKCRSHRGHRALRSRGRRSESPRAPGTPSSPRSRASKRPASRFVVGSIASPYVPSPSIRHIVWNGSCRLT